MYHEIKSNEDIAYFLEKTNSLHDGYIIGVQYAHDGISKISGGHSFDYKQKTLVIKILVTSLWDTVVELEFRGVFEWQIKDWNSDMTDTAILFNGQNGILWVDDLYIDMEDAQKGSYVSADSMRWRIVESNSEPTYKRKEIMEYELS